MEILDIERLTRVMQASITPVALISGMGLLILSQTNRFSRVTDRLRELIRHKRKNDEVSAAVEKQIVIFARRARILRASICYAVGCVLLAGVVVLMMFGIAVLDLQLHKMVLLAFGLSLACLVVSLLLFLRDMRLSLHAVQEEMADMGEPEKK